MFTRNYYKALAMVMSGGTASITYTGVTGADHTRAYDCSNAIKFGAKPSDPDGSHASMAYIQKSFNSNGGVVIGTGTTEPTLDDTTLSGDIISTFDYSCVLEEVINDSGLTATATYTITNTGDTAFTIGEIGLIANLRSTVDSDTYKALLERTLLGVPITIEPGGVGQVTYVLKLNFPT